MGCARMPLAATAAGSSSSCRSRTSIPLIVLAALAREDVAVRRLELRLRPLEAMFFALADDSAQPSPEESESSLKHRLIERRGRRSLARVPDRATQPGLKLAPRVLALLCVLGPFAFAAILESPTGAPADTIFGVSVHSSGFAVPLVVLTFARCGDSRC